MKIRLVQLVCMKFELIQHPPWKKETKIWTMFDRVLTDTLAKIPEDCLLITLHSKEENSIECAHMQFRNFNKI